MGTSTALHTHFPNCRDHPHACGDKYALPSCKVARLGSSPRVWGQVSREYSRNETLRIIPTRVGTRFFPNCRIFGFRDHPHACGDKSSVISAIRPCSGSSPRVWGQVTMSSNYAVSDGIIPTRVGTSTHNLFLSGCFWDHPHACGDKTKEIKENSGFAKSTA